MSYKKGIEEYQYKSLIALNKGQETTLLIEHNKELRRIQEHIGFVEEIKRGAEGEISTLKLRFANNTIVETKAFIDDSIKEKDLVSTWGFFDKEKNKLRYFCKGGIQRVIFKATDLSEFDFERTYRMGFTEISEAKESGIYIKNDKIEPIEDTGLYCYIGNITEIENSLDKNKVVSTTGPKKRIRFY